VTGGCRTQDRPGFAKQIAELRRPAEQGGRDPKTISITAFASPPDRKILDQ
jgi:hypothetical protein